jgi:hypothetical protein
MKIRDKIDFYGWYQRIYDPYLWRLAVKVAYRFPGEGR